MITASPPRRQSSTPGLSSRRATEEAITFRMGSADIPAILRRSPRARRLRVTIDHRRGLVVTVPARRAPSMRTIEAFLGEREAWLRRHLARRADALARVAALGGVVDGATVMYLGVPHRLRVVRGAARRRWSKVSRVGGDEEDELVVEIAPTERRDVQTILVAWFRGRAGAAIRDAIARHGSAMGVTPAAVTVRDQQTRWGSAARSGRLAFSWRLVLAPPEVLESVVIHELAHLRVFGHGPEFWALVATRCPEYRHRRSWLRRHGVELHAALSGG